MSKIFVTGHKSPDTDSVCAAIAYANLLKQTGHDAVAICAGDLNKETKYVLDHFGFTHPQAVSHFSQVLGPDDKVVLVDHNESKQIIDGHEDVNIVAVIDHHRLGDFETASPILIRIEPVGSSCTLVTKLYKEAGQEIPKNVAGVLMSAIISDTVLFRSDVSDLSAEDIVRTDMKEFSQGGQTISIAQISVMDTTDVLAQQELLVSALEALRSDKNYDASYLMVTNILDEATTLLYAGDVEGVVKAAFQKDVENNGVYLPKTMSRKKQIAPPILEAMA